MMVRDDAGERSLASWLEQARSLIARSQHELALKEYREIFVSYEQVPAEAYCSAGLASWEIGLVDSARALFERALELNPDQSDALLNLFELLVDERELEEASKHITDIKVRAEVDAESRAVYAKYLLVSGDESSGLNELKGVLESSEAIDSGWLRALEVMLTAEQYTDVALRGLRALGEGADHFIVFDLTGRALQALGRLDEAEKVFERMADRFAGAATPLCRLGVLKMMRGEFSAAKGFAETALQGYPNHAEANILLFSSLVGMERWEEIERRTHPFLEQDPPIVAALIFHLSALGRLDRASEQRDLIEKHGPLIQGMGLAEMVRVSKLDPSLLEHGLQESEALGRGNR